MTKYRILFLCLILWVHQEHNFIFGRGHVHVGYDQLKSEPFRFESDYVQNKKIVGNVAGSAVFAVKRINSDATVEGVVNLSLSESSRKMLAGVMSVPTTAIPNTLEEQNVLFILGKSSKCPKITLVSSTREIQFMQGRLFIKKHSIFFDLSEHSQEMKDLLCTWEYLAKLNRGHATQIGNKINTLLRQRDNTK